MNKVIAVVGPTASGKSRLAHALAKEIDSEIVSADSRLVYKKMNIGTAKPSLEERSEIPYHLIDIIEPNAQEFSLGNYLELAEPILQNIFSQKKYAIVVGGTGFYLRGLLENLNLPDVKPDLDFRRSFINISTNDLYAQLKAKAQNNVYKMHSNDRPRIIRALEIERNAQKQIPIKEKNFKVIWIGINYLERELLKMQIQKRTQNMIEQGLVSETQNLYEEFGELEIFHKTIGYKECLNYLKNQNSTLDELAELINISTRQYAKRQLTWFRANKAISWLNAAQNFDSLLEEAKLLVFDMELVN